MIPFRPHHSWWVQLLLMLWRWSPELLLLTTAFWYWSRTSDAAWPTWVQIAVPAVVLAAFLAWPWSRRWLLGLVWLLVTRHRLRTYFLQCGAYNRSGRLPWLTLSWPTPVGERVWVWLVPGLSLADFESDTAQIAVACWARDARVGRSKRLAGLVWVDVIRRDPLTGAGPITSTLLTDTNPVPADTAVEPGPVPVAAETTYPMQAPRPERQDGPLVVPRTVIDLDAIRSETADTTSTSGGSGARSSGGRSGKPAARARNGTAGSGAGAGGGAGAEGAVAPVVPVLGRRGEDVSDYL